MMRLIVSITLSSLFILFVYYYYGNHKFFQLIFFKYLIGVSSYMYCIKVSACHDLKLCLSLNGRYLLSVTSLLYLYGNQQKKFNSYTQSNISYFLNQNISCFLNLKVVKLLIVLYLFFFLYIYIFLFFWGFFVFANKFLLNAF